MTGVRAMESAVSFAVNTFIRWNDGLRRSAPGTTLAQSSASAAPMMMGVANARCRNQFAVAVKVIALEIAPADALNGTFRLSVSVLSAA